MLRALLGQPPQDRDLQLRETADAMDAFIRLSRAYAKRHPERDVRYRTYAVWGEGLRRSLDELEESLFAAAHFAAKVGHARWSELTADERLAYDRHVYFDKNAYIRMFSLLDKLGTLVNDLLELRTERVKVHFSYFTVLRTMRQSGRYGDLWHRLAELKDGHKEAMSRLRMRRNMEIHYMNAELKDDLSESVSSAYGDGGRLENLSANLADAREGWAMVNGTLLHTFDFACGWIRRMSQT